ncbi:PREDICTED: ly6/PLAUR domain-containing protein 3 [Bison bison bison]|uniref:Ly6/PLAUR domain-containing protein 3 n=1 Tax=Bison bison bison TaxID=43346 RepID=A0A6P3IGD5_BISBB|nr:PREDICTED: ly6/PLAUR domain-containing protein 3 [Bison bison bison]
MDPARKAGSWAVIWTTGWLLLLSLLLPEGAKALECYSCVQNADDGCSPQKMKTVKCAPGVEVCTEAVGAVETRTASFLLARLAGNESAYQPNGVECYSCVGLSRKECQGRAPPVVSCYNASDHFYKGCFDGNVTLTAANVTVSLPVRGCVQDEFCTRDSATGPGFTLSGSCCQGSRCNSDLRNKTYFSPQFPPLVLLPPPRSTTLAPNKSVSTSTSAPSSTVTTKATPVPTTTRSTTKAITPAQTNQTSPQEVGHETFREEEASLAGGASGHQDRRNMGQDPIKDVTHSKGSAAPWAGWVTLLLAMAAGALL